MQAASHKSQLSRQSLRTRVYPGEAKPLPPAILASSQDSAESQAHGFGCLTPAWAGGKRGDCWEIHCHPQSKDNSGFLSAVLRHNVHMREGLTDACKYSQGPRAPYLSKERPHLRGHTPFKKKKSSLNTLCTGSEEYLRIPRQTVA